MSNPKYEKIGAIEVKVIEECVEVTVECMNVAKRLCKIQRFGIFNRNPQEDGRPNWKHLREEMNDLRARLNQLDEMIDPLVEEGNPIG